MTHEELRAWCHGEMRALAGSPMHARGAAFLKLLDASLAPPWLADAAEALGEVRSEDSAPLALNWTQVIEAIHELREDRDHWKKRGEAAEIESAGGQDIALAACSESRRLILEMACSELGLCADAFEACSHAAEALRERPCGCGSAAKSVRAVIARWREQVRP